MNNRTPAEAEAAAEVEWQVVLWLDESVDTKN